MTPFYLAFQDEAQAISVLYITTVTAETVDDEGVILTEASTQVTPNYQNINFIGVVYQPAPDPLPDPYIPEPYPEPNFGVNVLVLDNEDSTPLQPYSVQPSPYPQRVWAI